MAIIFKSFVLLSLVMNFRFVFEIHIELRKSKNEKLQYTREDEIPLLMNHSSKTRRRQLFAEFLEY